MHSNTYFFLGSVTYCWEEEDKLARRGQAEGHEEGGRGGGPRGQAEEGRTGWGGAGRPGFSSREVFAHDS
jgi:hypothetical protein